MTLTEQSKLVKSQHKSFGPRAIDGYAPGAALWVRARYDDECGNGHNTFAITAHVTVPRKRDRAAGGCLHDEITQVYRAGVFDQVAFVFSDGPLHYLANTAYHASKRDLDAARACAIWLDATDADLIEPGLEMRLAARLPRLLEEFKGAMESLEFSW